MNSPYRSPSRKRGSILLVTVMLATGMALALGSFIALTVQSVKHSNRSFYSNSALNLAEAGIEEAISCLNRGDWSGWTTHASGSANKSRILSSFDLGHGATAEVKVVVFGATGITVPRVVAEGITHPSLGPPVTKQIEVQLSRRSHWATGIVAKDQITFSGGNAEVDSYKSSDPEFSTAGSYDPTKKRDRGTAGSASVTTDAVSISNSDIWGFVATGGSQPKTGPNGTIRGADTPAGVTIDPNRISTDFTANFEPEAAPTTFSSVYGNLSGNQELGTAGTTSTIQAASLGNTNNQVIQISGDVTLVVTNSVDIKGELRINLDSSLTLYVVGDVDIGGTGAVNKTGLPQNLIIYGVAPTPGGQTIKLHGNGILVGAIYAPNANLELKGGGNSGEMSGAAVAKTVKITGNYKFHYDEALQDLGSGNPFGIKSWRELLSAAERVNL